MAACGFSIKRPLLQKKELVEMGNLLPLGNPRKFEVTQFWYEKGLGSNP
jgi:hypothetical protein